MEKQSASNSKIKYFLSQQPPVELVVADLDSEIKCTYNYHSISAYRKQ